MAETKLPRIWLKAFWGFDPENDGYLGFTKPGDRRRLIDEARAGDLVLIYGADSENTEEHDRRQVLGILEIDPISIRDVDAMSEEGRRRKLTEGWQDRWTYAVPVLRAWRINRRIEVGHIAPVTYTHARARVIASRGELLTEAESASVYGLPVTAVSVFGRPPVSGAGPAELDLKAVFIPSRGLTPTFGSRESEYEDGDHFLYILNAEGDIAALLGRSYEEIAKRTLVKIGYSREPDRRCAEHNSTLPPAGRFKWKVHCKSKAYINGQDAKLAEDFFKTALASQFESLGGEFFLGDLEAIRNTLIVVPGASFIIRAPANRLRR
jgi:hypothetical protein